MADYVLVHGGFCDGWYWSQTAAWLEKEGHRVHVADLPSTGRDAAALGGLAEDAAEVRRLLDGAGEPVVLVGHSYGGMVLTEVADHPAIAHSVYVSAFWPARGQSLMDLFGPQDWMELAPDGTAARVTGDVEAARGALCADLDAARVPEWHASLMWSSAGILGTPSAAPDRGHPTTYVVLERDEAVPPAMQEAMAARADRVERMATSHVPMLVDPEGLAAILIRLPRRRLPPN